MDPVDSAARSAALEIAFALGLIRVLTLLPLYDGTLDEVEEHLAAGWEALREVQRLVEEDGLGHRTDRGL